MIHWLRPEWLLALIPSILLFIGLWRSQRTQNKNPWRAVCDPHLLAALCPVENNNRVSKIALIGLGFIWLISIVALCGPSLTRTEQPLYQSQHARVILLDMSSDMQASDLSPTRLTRARFKLMDFLNRIKEGQVALVVFSQFPYLVSPLTRDTNTLISMVPQLTPSIMPTQGFNLTRALKKAAALCKQANSNNADIIIMTAHNPNASAWSQVKKLASQGYNTMVWGIGTQTGGPITSQTGQFSDNSTGHLNWAKMDINTLTQFAKQGGGQFVNYSQTNSDVSTLLKLTKAQPKDKVKKQQVMQTLWLDQGRFLCWLIILLMAPCFLRGMWD